MSTKQPSHSLIMFRDSFNIWKMPIDLPALVEASKLMFVQGDRELVEIYKAPWHVICCCLLTFRHVFRGQQTIGQPADLPFHEMTREIKHIFSAATSRLDLL